MIAWPAPEATREDVDAFVRRALGEIHYRDHDGVDLGACPTCAPSSEARLRPVRAANGSWAGEQCARCSETWWWYPAITGRAS